MYFWKTWLVLGVAYFAIHFAIGFYKCHTGFCPGDRETEWVYEVEDSAGRRFVVVNGERIPEQEYRYKNNPDQLSKGEDK